MTAADARPRPRRIAAIDIGTVSTRLLRAELRDGRPQPLFKCTQITDLGEGVDATGRFTEAAQRRVLEACRGFLHEAAGREVELVCTTLTSAARDAGNGADLLAGLAELGLRPQVIPGEVEARLTFFGVAHDFAGQRIAVADSGGGSTEFAIGAYAPGEPLALERVRSLDIGCRRVTERFFSSLPPAAGELEHACAWVRPQFEAFWDALDERPDRLVAVGGTVTSLVAMVHGLVTYDSHFVHLHELSLAEVEASIERLRCLDAAGAAALPGIQPKRAPVMLAGALVIREAMRAGGYESLTVSENSLLAGATATMGEVLDGRASAIGWTPELSPIR